jgi:tRNA-specific 2-thiouridylase
MDNMDREIKFGSLLERLPINSTGNTWFATGHYARKSWVNGLDGLPRPQLLRGLDFTKDQSYYLCSISESGLRRALFPLGGLNKSEVRSLAKQYQLPTSNRPESMGICFVGEKTRFSKFLCERVIPSHCRLLVNIFQLHIFAQTSVRSLTRQQAR